MKLKQWIRLKLFVVIALTALIMAMVSFAVFAQEEEAEETSLTETEQTAAFTEASPFDNLAVVLVIDVSGSMSYTDPQRLRETAAGMFIDLLGDEDYLGVVIFDDRAELVVPLGPVGSPADKEAIMGKLSPQLDPRGDTDFIAGLQLAYEQFASTDIGDKVPVVLLLTDGEPDPFPGALKDEAFMDEYMESLWEQVGLLAGEGILVYTVGFSGEIDADVIKRIATETLGKYYMLPEPADLLVTFYRALEALKDRRSFLEEEVDLGAGGSHVFTFNVAEYTRQINLVLVSASEAEQAISVSVKPPTGSAENIDQLLLGGRDNYRSVILSLPQESHYGQWEVEVSGQGRIVALGNADLYLEALLIAPDPQARHPLHEPMELRVEVITREKYADAVFQLELQVTGPGSSVAKSVALTREGNSFSGLYEPVDLQGDYKIDWQLYLGDEVVFSNAAMVNVQLLPAITTDFYVSGEGFRLGEEMVISASLTSGGERMQQGPQLTIETFTLDLEYRDGARVELELFDSGDRAHGNSRAGDGIWSNRVLFDREGLATAVLTASGSYRDSNYLLKKSYSFSVSEVGHLSVRLLPEDLWSQPGESLVAHLEFVSESPFTQTVRIATPTDGVVLLQDRLIVPPGVTTLIPVEIGIGKAVETGRLYVTATFEAEDGRTPIQPELFDFQVQVLTAGEAFSKRFSGLAAGIGLIAAAAAMLSGLLFGGGSMLNRHYLRPRLRVVGTLTVRAEGGNPAPADGEAHKLNLEQLAKPQVVVAIGSGNRLADYVIPSDRYSYNMVIRNSWNDHLPRFLRGWKALFKRSLDLETKIKCTPPGVLTADGKVITGKDLHHADQFESGGYVFQYECCAAGEEAKISGRGLNILAGKE